MVNADAAIGQAFLGEARKQLQACAAKIQHCVDQLSDDQMWWRSGEDFNSIANLLLHLTGNITERILTLIGGEADQRDRDRKFAERGPMSKADLLTRFESAVCRSDAVLAALPADALLETRRYRMLAGPVQNTLVSLILQTLVHVGGHTQEIVALARLQLRDRYRFQQPRPRPA